MSDRAALWFMGGCLFVALVFPPLWSAVVDRRLNDQRQLLCQSCITHHRVDECARQCRENTNDTTILLCEMRHLPSDCKSLRGVR
jgi:hypothetical protein